MATATAFLELNLTGFDRAVSSAQRTLAALATAFVSFKTIQLFGSKSQEALKFADDLWRVSRTMGNMDVGALLISQKALESIGYSADGARQRMEELAGAGLPLSTAFSGAENYASALTTAAQQYGGTAAILSRSAERFSLVFDRLKAVSMKMKEFFLSAAEKFAGPLQILLDRIIAIDLGNIGARIGESIGKAISLLNGAMQNGTLGEMISTSFQLGAEYLRNVLARLPEVLGAAAIAIGTTINSVLASFDWVQVMGKAMEAVVSVISTVVQAIATAILRIVSAIGTGLGALIDMIPGVSGTAAASEEAFTNSASAINDMFVDYRKAIHVGGNIFTADAQLLGSNFRTAFSSAMETVSMALGDSPEAKSLKSNLQKLAGAALAAGEKSSASASGKPFGIVGKADPFKIIADSLASQGGGGGFVQVGQTLEAKKLIEISRYSQVTAEATQAMARAGRPQQLGVVNQQ